MAKKAKILIKVGSLTHLINLSHLFDIVVKQTMPTLFIYVLTSM